MSQYETEHPFEETAESRRRKRRAERESFHNDRPRRKRRWPWILLFLIVVIALLPNLIGWFGLQQKALDYALSDFNGKVSVEKVTLGWFQNVELKNITAVDAQGNALAEVASVTSTKPLYSFLTSSDYGEFNVQSPTAYVQLRPDGSNIEDAIAKYIQPADPNATPDPNAVHAPAKPLPHLTVNVLDGKAVVTSNSETRFWQIDQLNAVAETSSANAPLIIDAQCRVATSVPNGDQEATVEQGGLAIVSHIDAGSKILNFASADVQLKTQALPLSIAAPVLQRFIGPTNAAGNMNGKIAAAYSAPTNSVSVNVEQLHLTNFAVVAPELLGSDQFSLRNLSANGVIQASPSLISAQQFNLSSDVGMLRAEGSFDVNQVTNLASGQLLDTPFDMNGEIDLAALVRMLPSTLKLHDDLVVNSGKVTFQAGSNNGPEGRRLVVNLDTANLNANRGAQNIVWAKPLRLVGTVKESQGQLSLENVRCISDFLEVSGDADMKTAAFVVKGDLQKLMGRVGEFVDLQGTQLAGVINGKFGWQVADGQAGSTRSINGIENLPIQIGGSFVVANPVIEMPGMARWAQPQMSVKLSGAGQSLAGNKLRLDQGGVQVDIGSEQLIARLAQPVADAFTNQVWDANCQMTGSMAGWIGHVQNFVDLGDIKAAGNLNLVCAANLNPKNIQLSNIQYAVEQLAFDGYGVKIAEPKATGAGVVVYDLASGTIAIPDATLIGSSVSAQAKPLEISFPSNMRVDGKVVFKADVRKVSDWFELSPTQDSVFWFGGMDGTIQLASNEHGITGRINSTVSDLIAANQVAIEPQRNQQGQIIQASATQRGWQELWRESKVAVNGDVTLANDFNAVAFQNLNFDSSGFKANANGSLSDLAGNMIADVKGVWIPDWQKVNSLLAAYSGEMVRFAGQRQHTFAVRGPIFETTQPGQPASWVPSSLQAGATIGWDQGEVLGLAVGKSDLEINLDQGIGQVRTQGIPFAGGLIQFAPRVDMRGPEPVLTMDQTRLINNVALQPETARQWLKFVAPLAADATSAQGNFTVDIGAANVPLLDPMKLEAKGAVRLSNVVIGAGPTAEKLLGTVKQLRAALKPDASDRDLNTWLKMDEQTVPILVRDGRVYHDKLKFSHKDLTLQTSGSVGLDQSLNMVAQIPIADDWIKDKPYLASLRGQSISIPIRGTVSQPVLDKSSIQNLTRNLAKEAAGNAINKAVREKLNPKLDQYKEQLNGKIGNELNKLQGKLGEKLGAGLGEKLGGNLGGNILQNPNLQNLRNGIGGAIGQQPAGGQTADPIGGIKQQLNNKLEEELKNGFGKLFGK